MTGTAGYRTDQGIFKISQPTSAPIQFVPQLEIDLVNDQSSNKMFLIGNEGLYSKLLLTFYAEFTEDGSNRQIFRDKESLGGSSGVKETPVI